MSKITFLQDYNNYYNRIIKNNKKEIISSYSTRVFNNVNFNPADGLTTELVVNWDKTWTPDYMMVDLTASELVKPWTEYMTGFYWGIDYHQYDYEATGTPEEVKSQLVSDGYYDTTTESFDIASVWSDYHGEIDREYDCFGFDFDADHRLPVGALKIRFSDVGDEVNYFIVTVSFLPSGYVSIPSYELINNTLDYNTIKKYYPSLNSNTKIYNIDCEPNNKEEESYYPDRVYQQLGEGENIMDSSWFVMEWTRTRKDQYSVKLKRDILADKLDVIKTAPMIIDRAMITDTSNPLLFNPEGFSFNQIKKSETLLRQKYGNDSTFYALYFAKDYVGAGLDDQASFPDISGSISIGTLPYNISIGTPIANSIYAQAEYIDMTDDWYRLVWFDDMHWYSSNKSNQANFTTVTSTLTSTSYPNSITTEEYTDSCWIVEERATALPAIEYQFINSYASLRNALKTQKSIVENSISDSNYRSVKAANGLTIKDSDNRYWRVSVVEENNSYEGFCDNDTDALVLEMKSRVEDSNMEIWGDFESKSSYYHYKMRRLKVQLTELPNSITLNYSINFGNFYNTDSPYNIVYIPANKHSIRYGGTTYICDENINKEILEQVMLKAGKWLLDVQIMPYHPVLEDLAGGNSLIYGNATNYYISNQGSTAWYCYYVHTPSFEFNIPANDSNSGVLNLKINNSDNPTALDYKIENECNLYRICSPNYNGSFDFSLAKNNGFTAFNIDVTLRPYNPYIHINPVFNGLYGSDFNDCRGLVCQGDFSVPIITDQFKNYEIANKNYQQMFNRQMANLDFTQSQERTTSAFQLVSGTVQGTTTGAIAGGMIGGGWGAVAGAAIGAGTSLAGGMLDYAMLTSRQQEAKDYAIDSYRFQLGNIKALPTTVNKITPLTNNNKIFPVLEFYSCTDEEKSLFSNYLTYKSMNISAIGSISDYQQDNRTFIQGTFIRLENIDLTGNELFEIFNEMKKGVYI